MASLGYNVLSRCFLWRFLHRSMENFQRLDMNSGCHCCGEYYLWRAHTDCSASMLYWNCLELQVSPMLWFWKIPLTMRCSVMVEKNIWMQISEARKPTYQATKLSYGNITRLDLANMLYMQINKWDVTSLIYVFNYSKASFCFENLMTRRGTRGVNLTSVLFTIGHTDNRFWYSLSIHNKWLVILNLCTE